MALTPTTSIPLGFQAPAFSLPDTVLGNTLSFNDVQGQHGTLVMFICNHCPFVKHVVDGLVALGNDYKDKGIGIVAISSNDVVNYPEDHPDQMAALARAKGFSFPYLYDATQEVAKAYERKYGTILEDDLEGDLDETELDEIRAIINSLKLPQDRITTQHLKLWTKRLRAAWDTTCWIFSCTDEDAAYSVLEDILKTVDPRGAYRMLETHYERTQHITMQEEAESEMDSSEMEKWNRLKNQILSNRTMIA